MNLRGRRCGVGVHMRNPGLSLSTTSHPCGCGLEGDPLLHGRYQHREPCLAS